MRRHTEIYLTAVAGSTTPTDPILCEVCGTRAVDIHHIFSRGMGGSKEKDRIENLMAVCRKCHNEYGDKTEQYEYLLVTHFAFLSYCNIIFDYNWRRNYISDDAFDKFLKPLLQTDCLENKNAEQDLKSE